VWIPEWRLRFQANQHLTGWNKLVYSSNCYYLLLNAPHIWRYGRGIKAERSGPGGADRYIPGEPSGAVTMSTLGGMPNLRPERVYANLRLPKDEGDVLKLDPAGTLSRSDGNTRNHYHFRCEKCGRVYDVGEPWIKRSIIG